MRYKGLIITTSIFFLLVNTTYFWECKLGFLAFPSFIIMFAVFVGLAIALISQLFHSIKEKFTDRQRIFLLILLTIVIGSSFLRPKGLIDFESLSGNDILIAQREGSANCTTTFKLKENSKFVDKSICFGVSEITGIYKLKNDTIFFSNIVLPRHEKDYYEFALIEPSRYSIANNTDDLVMYKNSMDTIGHELWIIKNEFTNRK